MPFKLRLAELRTQLAGFIMVSTWEVCRHFLAAVFPVVATLSKKMEHCLAVCIDYFPFLEKLSETVAHLSAEVFYGTIVFVSLGAFAVWQDPSLVASPGDIWKSIVAMSCASLFFLGLFYLDDAVELPHFVFRFVDWAWIKTFGSDMSELNKSSTYVSESSTTSTPTIVVSETSHPDNSNHAAHEIPRHADMVDDRSLSDTSSLNDNESSSSTDRQGGPESPTRIGSSTRHGNTTPVGAKVQPLIIPPTPLLPHSFRGTPSPPPEQTFEHSSGLLGDSPGPKHHAQVFKHFSGEYFHKRNKLLEASRRMPLFPIREEHGLLGNMQGHTTMHSSYKFGSRKYESIGEGTQVGDLLHLDDDADD